jgi:LPS-assembly lipoprotein
MWSRSRAFVVVAVAAIAGLGLSGCGFQPLYGSSTTTASGTRLSEAMAAVDVQPIPGRVGQKVRNELIFASTGGGNAAPPRYKLKIALREQDIQQLVQVTGNAQGQVYQLQANYSLIDSTSGATVHQGTAIARAPYTRFQEVFANVRARYNAEDRAAETVSQSIKSQLAAYLATT